MTKREKYLRALSNERTDELVYAPNFDYWLACAEKERTLPSRYEGMSRNDIVRSMDAYIWNRCAGLREVVDASVKYTLKRVGRDDVTEIMTPVGEVRGVMSATEGEHRSMAATEHYIKTTADIKVMKYIAEATDYLPDYETTRAALNETGGDGVVLNSHYCVPFIQFAKTDAGYADAFYIFADHRGEVDGLLEVYREKFLQAYGLLARGPADIIATGDNMDGVMISPPLFMEYAAPFYRELKKITSEHGKLLETHWCGRTENLLGLVPETGIDIVEAIVTEPMAPVTLTGALDMLRGEVVLQGGIPSVLLCDETCTADEFKRYIYETICPLKSRRGFVLGMADNVPPNADFSRVEMIAGLIK